MIWVRAAKDIIEHRRLIKCKYLYNTTGGMYKATAFTDDLAIA